MGWAGDLVMGKMSLRTTAQRTVCLVLLSASDIHAGVFRKLLGPLPPHPNPHATDRTPRLRGEAECTLTSLPGSQALFRFTLGRATTSSRDDSLAPLWATLRVGKGFILNSITVFFLNLRSLVLFLPFQPA